ncbi:MAG: DNA repair protein RecO [Methylophilales bacterium]|nr:DNA repair protein RecO [Methylophilales bacterium]
MTSPVARQDQQPVYVLHTYPYLETSLVVELFTRNFGRVAAIAKGARRPRSAMRGMLQSFQPLLASWSGKSELRTLHGAEWRGGLHMLHGQALMCGFYLNELMLRLLPREDAHEALFEYYQDALAALAKDEAQTIVLRRFEVRLLQELGYAMPLTHTAESDSEITPQAQYTYVPERGAMLGLNQAGVQLTGKTLLDMAQDDYTDAQTQQQSKQLMRALISHHMGDKPLHTRQLLIDLQQL